VKLSYGEFNRGFNVLLSKPKVCMKDEEDVSMEVAMERARQVARGKRAENPLRERVGRPAHALLISPNPFY